MLAFDGADSSSGFPDRSAQWNLAEFTHELRTPLHSLLASVEMLIDEPELRSDRSKAHLARITRAADHLNDLVDRFLSFTAEEYGLRDAASPVDLKAVAEHVISIIYPLAAKRGLQAHTRVDVSSPYFGSSGHLRQIMLNLLGNAVKYTDAGEVGLAIRCDARWLDIEIWDTGRGIPAEYLPLIFDPFFRVPGTEATEGSGLGLSTVATLIGKLGGTIQVASHEQVGTHFHVRMPSGANA